MILLHILCLASQNYVEHSFFSRVKSLCQICDRMSFIGNSCSSTAPRANFEASVVTIVEYFASNVLGIGALMRRFFSVINDFLSLRIPYEGYIFRESR